MSKEITFRKKTVTESVDIMKGGELVERKDILFYQENKAGVEEIIKKYGYSRLAFNFNRQNKADIVNPIRTGDGDIKEVKKNYKDTREGLTDKKVKAELDAGISAYIASFALKEKAKEDYRQELVDAKKTPEEIAVAMSAFIDEQEKESK